MYIWFVLQMLVRIYARWQKHLKLVLFYPNLSCLIPGICFFYFCDDFFSYLTEQSCYGLPHSSLSYKFNLNMHSGGLILLFLLVWSCRNLCLSEIWGDGGAGCNSNNNRYSVVEVKAFFAS